MDPEACLQRALDRARAVMAAIDEGGDADDATIGAAILHDANELAEAVQNLDEWLRGGGFLPRAWEQKRGRK